MSTRCPELPWGPESEAHVTEDATSLKEVSIPRSELLDGTSMLGQQPCGPHGGFLGPALVLPGGPLISYGLQTALRGPDEPAGPT